MMQTGTSVNAIIWERYFALTSNADSKTALNMFRSYTLMNGCAIIGGTFIILIKPLFNLFFVEQDSINSHLAAANDVVGLEDLIDTSKLIIIRIWSFNPIPLCAWGLLGYACLIMAPCLVGLLLNFFFSMVLESQTQMSSTTQKMNEMFRRLIFIQTSGIFIFGILPGFACICVLVYSTNPTPHMNFIAVTISGMQIWDSFMTCIFVKPYRQVLFYPIYYFIKRWNVSKIAPILSFEETQMEVNTTPTLLVASPENEKHDSQSRITSESPPFLR